MSNLGDRWRTFRNCMRAKTGEFDEPDWAGRIIPTARRVASTLDAAATEARIASSALPETRDDDANYVRARMMQLAEEGAELAATARRLTGIAPSGTDSDAPARSASQP